MTDAQLPPPQLQVRKLTLFSHGVASLDLTASVCDDATLSLTFPERHMNDVLKTLTVVDDADGKIASISYEAPSDTHSNAPHTLIIDPGNPLKSLLQTAQGASVTLQLCDSTSPTGIVLGLQSLPTSATTSKSDSFPEPSQTLHLVLLQDGWKVSTHDICHIVSVDFVDEQLQRLLGRRMRAAATMLRSKSNKSVTITAKGEGQRNIHVNYAVESPVPKLTYRFLLRPPGRGKVSEQLVFVQGWAIVDNPSDDDLTDIDVTIVSGLPISFRHDLYGARYIERPEEEVPTASGSGYAKPSVATFGMEGIRKKTVRHSLKPLHAGKVTTLSSRNSPAASYQTAYYNAVPKCDNGEAEENVSEQDIPCSYYSAENFPQMAEQSAGPSAETSEVGDLFEYNIPVKVTIKAQESALVPLIMQDCEGGRVDIYSHKVRTANTLSAVRIKNTTDATFEGGPVSVYERSRLVGEGMLASCRPSSEQFLPYSVDLDCIAELFTKEDDGDVVSTFAVGDFFQTTRYRESVKEYVFRSNKSEDIDLYVLHELKPQFNLQSATLKVVRRPGEAQGSKDGKNISEVMVKPVNIHDGVARYFFKIPGGQTATLIVNEKKQQMQKLEIRRCCSSKRISALRRSRLINANTAEKMKEILQVELKISQYRKEVLVLKQQIEALEAAQGRYRQNLQSLGRVHDSKKSQGDPLIDQFLKCLADSEEKIQATVSQVETVELRMRELEMDAKEKVEAFGGEQLQESLE